MIEHNYSKMTDDQRAKVLAIELARAQQTINKLTREQHIACETVFSTCNEMLKTQKQLLKEFKRIVILQAIIMIAIAAIAAL